MLALLRKIILLCAAALTLAAQPATAQERPPLEAYGDLPGIEHVAISASGGHIGVISKIADTRKLLMFDSSLALIRAADVEGLKVRDIEWIGDEAVLVTISETEDLPMGFTTRNFESHRAITVPLNGNSPVQMVFTNTRSIVHSVFGNHGIRKVGGRWKGYFGGIALERSVDRGFVLNDAEITLFEVDLLKNSATKHAPPPPDEIWRDWLVDEDGNVAARFDMNQSKGDWRIVNSKGKEIAAGKHPDGDAGLVALGNDGSSLIFSSEDDGATRWFELPLEGGREPVEILAREGVQRIYLGKNSGRLLGYRRKDDESEPVFFDPEWNARAAKVARAFSKFDFDIVDWDDAFSKVLVRTSGNGDSGTWFLVDISNLSAAPFGYERLAIGPNQVGPVSTFPYVAQDGLEMDGILTLPPGREAKNLPVIMLPHGGPSSYDAAEFHWWAQAFASRGYAVFQPNFRGSTNRTEAFQRAGFGEWGRKMQTDISDGLSALATAGIVDPKRACIMGASYGGYAALAGVTLQQGLYRCSVSVAGIGDLKRMYDTDVRESGRSQVMRKALEEELGRRSDLADVSPENFAARADAPILLIHGRDDIVVRYDQSTRMAKALEKAGKPYEFVELKAEDHWLSRAETRKQMLSAAMEFVQKHNPAD